MANSKVENDIQLPLFQYINEELSNSFEIDKNEIGTSELHYGMKKLVINKLHEIEQPSNMKELFGTIIHKLLEYNPVRQKIIQYINNYFNIEIKPISQTEKKYLIEILSGQNLRMHPDIESPFYAIECKTTQMKPRIWTRETAFSHILQLNDYLNHRKKQFGILIMINQNAFLSSSKNWDRIMKDYSYCLRFELNIQEWQNSLQLAKFLFECINEEDIENPNLICPVYQWECSRKHCNLKTIEICGKELYKCPSCKRKECVEYPHELTNQFIDNPLCESCFLKANPHSKYVKFKFKFYKEKEVKKNG